MIFRGVMNAKLDKWLGYIEEHFKEKPEWFSVSYISNGMHYTITYDYRTGEFTEEWHPTASDIEL